MPSGTFWNSSRAILYMEVTLASQIPKNTLYNPVKRGEDFQCNIVFLRDKILLKNSDEYKQLTKWYVDYTGNENYFKIHDRA